MDPCRGRIIQAYHDGHELVLCKSKLFDFSDAETAPFELFLQHMACVPVGNTENFPEPLQAEDGSDEDIPIANMRKPPRPAIPTFEPPIPKESQPDEHQHLPL